MSNLFRDLPTGPNPPEEIYVVVDIPKGSSNKYDYDEEKDFFELDRVLYSPLFFPFEYGFIPRAIGGDGESLDVILLTSFPTFPGCVIKARPIGVFLMRDEEGEDNKVVAVPLEKVDPYFKEIKKIEDLPRHFRKEIEIFFADYKKLETEKYKFVKIEGWQGVKEAKKLIKKAMKRYAQHESRH